MGKKITNVFDASIYDSCIGTKCEGMTQHKSGYCEKCRTFECLSCKRTLILSKFNRKKPQCALCLSKGKKI